MKVYCLVDFNKSNVDLVECSKKEFIQEAKRIGMICSQKDFQYYFNVGEIDINHHLRIYNFKKKHYENL